MSDGSINIDTKIDTKGFNEGMEDINTSAKGAMDKVQGEVVDTSSQASGLTKVLAGVFEVITGGKGIALQALALIGIGIVALIVAVIALTAAFVLFGISMISKMVSALNSTTAYGKEVQHVKDLFDSVQQAVFAAFSPIVAFALPYIERVVSWLITMLNLLGMIIGKLLGQNKVWQYIAGSTKGAAQAAKNALAAFDQINVLNQGGGGQNLGAGLFEEVKIPEGFMKWWDDFKKGWVEFWKDPWKNAVTALDTFFNVTMPAAGEKFHVWWDNEFIPSLKEGWANLVADSDTFFNKTMPVAGENFHTWWDNEFIPGLKTGWDNLMTDFWTTVDTFFTVTLPGIVDAFSLKWYAFWADVTIKWDEFWAGITVKWDTFWNTTLPGILNTFLLGWNTFWSDRKIGWDAFWGLIKTNWDTFWTTTLPGVWETFKTKWGTFLDGIGTAFNTVFNGIGSFVVGVINNIIGHLNTMGTNAVEAVNKVIRAFNAIPLLPDIGTLTWTNIGTIGGTYTPPPIITTRLAAGAVIQPNAPFAAMLGDQKSGRNIEAPEDLIRKIVREEGGGGGNVTIRFEGTMGELIRLMNPHIIKENNRVGISLVSGEVV